MFVACSIASASQSDFLVTGDTERTFSPTKPVFARNCGELSALYKETCCFVPKHVLTFLIRNRLKVVGGIHQDIV